MNKRSHAYLTEKDPVLGALIERIGPLRRTPRRLPPFQALVQSVIYQQLNGKAADTILGRFKALFPGGAFPSPQELQATDVEQLRSAGLSRPKATYVREIAAKTLDGLVPSLEECDTLTDAAIIERLTEIKGVGRWTVEMSLIFNLGRPDVLPAHDLGVRKGFQIAYRKRQLPEPEQLDRFSQRWSPHRSTAALYLWRAADGEAEAV